MKKALHCNCVQYYIDGYLVSYMRDCMQTLQIVHTVGIDMEMELNSI